MAEITITTALAKKSYPIIRARCQRFGPQTAPSLARALGLSINRTYKGEIVPDARIVRQFEAALDELCSAIGLEKCPSLGDPKTPAYRVSTEQEVG